MADDFRHKGWHSRGYLPHLDAAGEIQALTFRLADAMPAKVIQRWKVDLLRDVNDDLQRNSQLHKLIAHYEDAGHGSCALRDPACAEIVQNVLLHFDGERYRLLEWCVMPNHVHVMIHCRFGYSLGAIVRSWKTFSAKKINECMGTTGALWAPDYYDRYIRDLDHLADARIYIRNNPVKAGLCQTPEDWPWSSAHHQKCQGTDREAPASLEEG